MQCHMLLWRYGATPLPRRRGGDAPRTYRRGWIDRIRGAWLRWRTGA